MHIHVGKTTIIGLHNGLSPGRRQAIIWTNAGILLIVHLGKNQWNIDRNSYIFIQENAFVNVVCQMASILYRHQYVNAYSDIEISIKVNYVTNHLGISQTSS